MRARERRTARESERERERERGSERERERERAKDQIEHATHPQPSTLQLEESQNCVGPSLLPRDVLLSSILKTNKSVSHCQAYLEQISQSRPNCGLGLSHFQHERLKPFKP